MSLSHEGIRNEVAENRVWPRKTIIGILVRHTRYIPLVRRKGSAILDLKLG